MLCSIPPKFKDFFLRFVYFPDSLYKNYRSPLSLLCPIIKFHGTLSTATCKYDTENLKGYMTFSFVIFVCLFFSFFFKMCTVGLYVSLCLMIFLRPFWHCKALRTAMYKRYITSIIIIIIIINLKKTDACTIQFSTLVVTAPHHGGRGLSFVAFLAASVFHVLRVDPNVEWRSK